MHLKFLKLIRLLTSYWGNVGVFSYKSTAISRSQQMLEEHGCLGISPEMQDIEFMSIIQVVCKGTFL